MDWKFESGMNNVHWTYIFPEEKEPNENLKAERHEETIEEEPSM